MFNCRSANYGNYLLQLLLISIGAMSVVLVANAQFRYSAVRTSSISGRVTDESGLAIQATVTAVAGPLVFTALTGADGLFRLTQLPAGSYILCGSPTASTWEADPLTSSVKAPPKDPFVDSCAGIDSRARRVSVKTGESYTGAALSLSRGKILNIQVNDPGKLLQALDSKQPGAEVFIHIVGPSGLVHRVPVLAADAAGRNYRTVIPYDQPQKLFVHSKTANFKDDKGSDLAVTPIELSATRDGPDLRRIINVAAKGAK